MSNLVNYRVPVTTGPGAGSIRFLCSYECSERFLTATNTPDEALERSPRRIKTSCVHCAWCGSVTGVPVGECVFHDDDCPDFDPMTTVKAAVAIQRLRRRVGGQMLTPRAMTYLEDTLGGHMVLGIQLPLDELVARVWDVRVDWMK